MKRMKLTFAGRIVLFAVIIALVVGAVCVGSQWFTPSDDSDNKTNSTTSTQNNDKNNNANNNTNHNNESKNDELTINLSLDEWIGWEPILYANGGLTTQSDSIFDKLDLSVKIHIINDADSSSNALIKGDLNAAGYTLNRVAFLSGKFTDAGLDIVMPVFTNYSNGGDGIIALSNIETIEDLVNAKIGVPKYSEAQSLVVWFVNKSDLTNEQKKTIINNLILLDDAEQTGQAFFAGSLDVAATWQPYLSYAEESTNSHILFDTSSSKKLIMDGIVFRTDFAEAHPDIVSKFIEGVFMALEEYESDFDTIQKTMPMFAGMSNEEIAAMRLDASMMGYTANINVLVNDCPTIYADMCDVWERIGETVNYSLGDTLFDTSYMTALEGKYEFIENEEENEVIITNEQKEEALNFPAMLQKSCIVEFVPDTAKFLSTADANATLQEFIEIARILDGTIIQIEGNVNSSGAIYTNDALSLSRAEAVKNFFVVNGIDPNRIIIIGNGNSKMVADPNGEDAQRNRRTDISFKTIGA